ncbi:MAG TPA: R3H domain-containing nucleic acid-binding protein [Candidatus Tumulicola sp.]|jgi:spoIIIJ-associated protein
MLYEDDFEFEEQPANIRDRAIPGKSGGGGGGGGRGPGNGGRGSGGDRGRGGRPRGNGGGRRYGPPLHHTGPSTLEHFDLPEQAIPARDLLTEILARMGVGQVDIHYIPRSEGEYLEVTGPDLGMLIGRHGNTLEALNLIFNNILNAGVRTNRKYFTIDAEGYRARRAEQLKNLALATAERCVSEGAPQRLEPMLPSERKIIHLALAESPDVRTESEGEEPERRLVVFPA